MIPTDRQKKLINNFSQLLYNWRNREDIDNVFFDELITEEVANMDIPYEHKIDAIKAFITLIKIVKLNE